MDDIDVYEQFYRIVKSHPDGISFLDVTRCLCEMGYREETRYHSESFLTTMEVKGYLLSEDTQNGIVLLFAME